MTPARQKKVETKSLAKDHIDRNQAIFTAAAIAISQTTRGNEYPQEVEDAVFSLYNNVPDIKTQAIAELLGLSWYCVRTILMEGSEEFNLDENRKADATHIGLLKKHHPGRQYEDHEGAVAEFAGQNIPMRAKTLEITLP